MSHYFTGDRNISVFHWRRYRVVDDAEVQSRTALGLHLQTDSCFVPCAVCTGETQCHRILALINSRNRYLVPPKSIFHQFFESTHIPDKVARRMQNSIRTACDCHVVCVTYGIPAAWLANAAKRVAHVGASNGGALCHLYIRKRDRQTDKMHKTGRGLVVRTIALYLSVVCLLLTRRPN